MLLRTSANDEPHQEIVMKIALARVFVLRIWLGVRLLRFAIWVIGGSAQAQEPMSDYP
jgi:hypothetical protein